MSQQPSFSQLRNTCVPHSVCFWLIHTFDLPIGTICNRLSCFVPRHLGATCPICVPYHVMSYALWQVAQDFSLCIFSTQNPSLKSWSIWPCFRRPLIIVEDLLRLYLRMACWSSPISHWYRTVQRSVRQGTWWKQSSVACNSIPSLQKCSGCWR